MKGTVKWYSKKLGYGFLVADDGTEHFMHHTAIKMKGFRYLHQGDIVEFEIGTGNNGREQAVNVTPIAMESDTNSDPRETIVNKIANEFGVEIPLMSWSGMELAELEAYYEELKNKTSEDEKEAV